MASDLVTDLFVYGTLKRGECREPMWPHPPATVRLAYIQARLYDLGPYPALRADVNLDDPEDWDWVEGECWHVSPSHFDETLRVLDDIEGTNQTGHRNLYDQLLVRTYDWPASPTSQLALVYQYSNAARLKSERRMRPAIVWNRASQSLHQEATNLSPPASPWPPYTVRWTGRNRA